MPVATKEKFRQHSTGIFYEIGDLYGYPDSLIRARTSAAYRFGLQLIDNKPQNVLDVGSGRGHGLVEIQNAFLPHPTHIVSLDPHVGSMDTQRRGLAANDLSLPAHFVSANNTTAFADGTFDLVTIMHVIEHIKEPKKLLNNIHRSLSPNGQLLMATPDVKNLVGDNPADEHVFDGKELTDLLKSCGFKPELYYVIPNERAHITHKNKQWLGTNAPWTVAFRNLNHEAWEEAVLRRGVPGGPLTADDFSISQEYDERAIDLLVVGKKGR